MKRMIWVVVLTVLLAFWCVSWLSPEELEEPVPEIDYEKELDIFYRKAVEENVNKTLFITKVITIDDKNFFAVGVLRIEDCHCIKGTDWNSRKCFFFFEDDVGLSVRFITDEELFSEYDFSSPIGLHLVEGKYKGYEQHFIKQTIYEVTGK